MLDKADLRKGYELFLKGVQAHILPEPNWDAVLSHYVDAANLGLEECWKFVAWAHKRTPIKLPIKLEGVSKKSDVVALIEMLMADELSSIATVEIYQRGAYVSKWLDKRSQNVNSVEWNTVQALIDASKFGKNYHSLKNDLVEVGLVNNVLDKAGIPVPFCHKQKGQYEEGWDSVDELVFANGTFQVVGKKSTSHVPLIIQQDLDTICALVGNGWEKMVPSFSLDRLNGPFAQSTFNSKIFSPDWLAGTEFGRSMYQADWLMKAMSMANGVPSFTEPFESGGTQENWPIPLLAKEIYLAKGNDTLANGSEAQHTRLNIVGTPPEVEVTAKQSADEKIELHYRIMNTGIRIANSIIWYDEDGVRHDERHDDYTTRVGAQAKLLEDNHDELCEMFPVFRRVELLLAIYAIVSSAVERGFRFDWGETMSGLHGETSDAFSHQTLVWQSVARTNVFRAGETFSIRAYHAGGCTCSGGVTAQSAIEEVKPRSENWKTADYDRLAPREIPKHSAQIWAEHPFKRGRIIENVLERTEYLDWDKTDSFEKWPTTDTTVSKAFLASAESKRFANNFPAVDFMRGNIAVSVKSVDPNSRYWMFAMSRHIDQLANTEITDGSDNKFEMRLDVRFPSNSNVQDKYLNGLREYARKKGVFVSVGTI